MGNGCRKKKLLLLGAAGRIGRALHDSLSETYHITLADKRRPKALIGSRFRKIDITKYRHLLQRIPTHIDVIINLTALREMSPLPSKQHFRKMSQLYVTGTYNVYRAALRKGVPKVIFASTNHVTGLYELGGASTLGREITPADYPAADSVYGAMKLCGEQFGFLFATTTSLSVICLRVGSFPSDEVDAVRRSPRTKHTLLSRADAIGIFRAAIECDRKYGVYYAVSDNPRKPWSMGEAVEALGYIPAMNSERVAGPADPRGNDKDGTWR